VFTKPLVVVSEIHYTSLRNVSYAFTKTNYQSQFRELFYNLVYSSNIGTSGRLLWTQNLQVP